MSKGPHKEKDNKPDTDEGEGLGAQDGSRVAAEQAQRGGQAWRLGGRCPYRSLQTPGLREARRKAAGTSLTTQETPDRPWGLEKVTRNDCGQICVNKSTREIKGRTSPNCLPR